MDTTNSSKVTHHDYPYPDNPGQTHYEGCWRERGHHNCAVHRVEQLEAEVNDLRYVPDNITLKFIRDQARAEDDSYTNGVAAQRLYIDALEAKLRSLALELKSYRAGLVVCSYCGAEQEYTLEAMAAHMAACTKRPEKRMEEALHAVIESNDALEAENEKLKFDLRYATALRNEFSNAVIADQYVNARRHYEDEIERLAATVEAQKKALEEHRIWLQAKNDAERRLLDRLRTWNAVGERTLTALQTFNCPDALRRAAIEGIIAEMEKA